MKPNIDPKYYREVFPLTEKQELLLFLLQEYHEQKGKFPSFRKLTATFNYKSTWAITKMIEALIKKGYITRSKRGEYRLEKI